MASPVVLRAQAASLKRDYPGWHFIVSSAGRIWAQRRQPNFLATAKALGGDIIAQGRGFEVYEMVDGDTALEVREKIASKEGR